VEWGIESAESSPYSFFDIPGFRWFPIFEVGEPLRLPLAGLQLERGPIRNVRNTTLLVRRSCGFTLAEGVAQFLWKKRLAISF
jgi:hypothetical protein